MQDDVGGGDQLDRAHGEQRRVSGAGPDEVHAPAHAPTRQCSTSSTLGHAPKPISPGDLALRRQTLGLAQELTRAREAHAARDLAPELGGRRLLTVQLVADPPRAVGQPEPCT